LWDGIEYTDVAKLLHQNRLVSAEEKAKKLVDIAKENCKDNIVVLVLEVDFSNDDDLQKLHALNVKNSILA